MLTRIALRAGVLLFAALAAWHSLFHDSYAFPEPRPFTGAHWYNPYGLEPTEASAPGAPPRSSVGFTGDALALQQLRASFHAHARTWWGLTNASHRLEDVHAAYRNFDYDIIGISNYQSIRPRLPQDDIYLTVYEHGYSMGQQHQTVIGAPSVSWLDYLLPQTRHHKQDVLHHLSAEAELVIINHPNKSQGYSLEDMKVLGSYDGVEVLSRFAKGTEHWDAALSAGHPIWGFNSDDCHDLARPWHVATGWVVILAEARTEEAAIEAMRHGRFYSVWAKNKLPPNAPAGIQLEDGVLKVRLDRRADWIRFIGQDGRELREVLRSGEAEYTLQPDDTYVRVHVGCRGTELLFNPVFRYEEDPFERRSATVDRRATTIRRALAALGILLFVGFGFRSTRRRD